MAETYIIPKSNEISTKPKSAKISTERKSYQSNFKICRFFASNGYCSYGENCRYSHPTVQEDRRRPTNFYHNSQLQNSNYPRSNFSRTSANYGPIFNPVDHFSLNISEATPEALASLRNRDISALKRLYPNYSLLDEKFLVDFAPTDPDWHFDVKLIKLRVEFPLRYPAEKLVSHVVGPDLLPEILISHLNINVEKYLASTFEENQTRKERYFLLLRQFLKFFDKNLRTYFVEGLKKVQLNVQAKAAGITFVPPPPQRQIIEEHEEVDSGVLQENDSDIGDAEGNQDFDSHHDLPKQDSSKSNIELRFTDMELGANVATVEAKKLSFVIQCLRCKRKSDYTWCSKIKTSADRACAKCHVTQRLTFEPAQVHQYSAQIGWVKTEGLIPFDLVLLPSEFNVVCLNCNECTTRAGLTWGQAEIFWCHKCHTKVELTLHASKFIGINIATGQNAALATSTNVKVNKGPKDPVLQQGKPLPDMGTCKHYKKSFRWFRFPCCGKLYPCDHCHEDNEDHEIKFANRIVCGYCSKEQPYNSDKPCTSCSSYVTKVTTPHWEGGRGCRDSTKMSSKDKQKYKNGNKTISRKAFESKK